MSPSRPASWISKIASLIGFPTPKKRAQRRHASPSRQHIGTDIAAVIVAIALVAAPTVGAPQLAQADPAPTAALGFTIQSSPATVLAGDPVTFTYNWSCSTLGTPCQDSTITAPFPVSDPNSVGLSGCQASSDTSGNTPSTVVSATDVVWTFKPAIPGGTSGQLTLVCNTRNIFTPDGDTYTPTATYKASNAADAPATGNAVAVSATPQLALSKTRNGTVNNPFLDVPITYSLRAYNQALNYATFENSAPGGAAVQDVVVVDHIPATAMYDSSHAVDDPTDPSGVGTLSGQDPVTGLGGTLTFPAFGANHYDRTFAVNLTYPASKNTGHPDTPADHSDDVTNTASVTAVPYLRPNDPRLSATAAITHGFQPAGSGSAAFGISKNIATAGKAWGSQRGASATYGTSSSNSGNSVLDYSFTDQLPCTFASNWAATATPCSAGNLGYLSQSGGSVQGNATSYPISFRFLLTDGSTFTQTTTPGATVLSPAAPAFPSGVYVSSVTVSGTTNPGESAGIYTGGGVSPTLLSTAPNNSVYHDPYSVSQSTGSNVVVENCYDAAGGGVRVTDHSTGAAFAVPADSWSQCANLIVPPSIPIWAMDKYATHTAQAPGGIVDFSLNVTRHGYASPSSPVLVDVLPVGMDYVPGSVTVQSAPGTGDPGWLTPTVTTSTNGAGQTLVNISWPASLVLAGDSSSLPQGMTVGLQGKVVSGTAPGNLVNRADLFDSVYPYTASDAGTACFNTGNFRYATQDSTDVNGNGDTTEYMCPSSATFTVVSGASIKTVKTVKGSGDSAFVGSPNLGGSYPGTPATYNLAIQNQGNVPLVNMVTYDILPFVGDTGTSGALNSTPWNSAWAPVLTAVTAPNTVQVQYSTSSNPCRGEVFTAGASTGSAPTGCDNNWLPVPPTPIGTTKALRFFIAGPANAGAIANVQLNVNTPANAIGPHGTPPHLPRSVQTIALSCNRRKPPRWASPPCGLR